jgi:phosphohistidine phosphatase
MEVVVRLYLVQHAEAKPKEVDPERSLSEAGRAHAEQVAAVAARLDLQVYEIWHSGKTRAAQTASAFAAALAPDQGVRAVSGLGPVDDVEPIGDELGRLSEPVMLVGHLPFMERLTGYLVTGDAERPVVDFTNSAIVCLARDGSRWQVVWILTPEIAAALDR